MPNRDIFCNSPWYELHIYWDGGLGFCCQQSHRLYTSDLRDHYNVRNMSIREWYDSQVMRDVRLELLGQHRTSYCSRCYTEETHTGSSRRHRSNQKSVIFTKAAFESSFQQSPGFEKFATTAKNHGAYSGMPIDLHIDLGNYCNLACKMCSPEASSRIAAQHVRWKIHNESSSIGQDWTQDSEVWNRVINEIASIPECHNIHFMGGETLITKRFEDFVDRMLELGRTDLNFSFISNGTTYNPSLMAKLKKFGRVGIEISIECLTQHNAYQRQGTDTAEVLSNIERYIQECDRSNIDITLRPAVSALTIGYYPTLLAYCLEKNLLIKNLVVHNPEMLDPRILPISVRKIYARRYQDFADQHQLESVDTSQDFNESNIGQLKKVIKQNVMGCLNLLTGPRLYNSDQLLAQMIKHCQRWDSVYGYNARELYPEFKEIFDEHNY